MKILKYLALLLLPLLLSSCMEDNSYNFPKAVNFSQVGGDRLYSGGNTVTTLEISDASRSKVRTGYSYDDNKTITVGLDWLIVTSHNASNASELSVKAKTNTTGKPRKLYIHCFFGNSSCDIKVTQSK